MNEIKFAFFGTPFFAEVILDKLEHAGFLPSVIITTPDKPKDRGLALAIPETKKWARERNILVFQPVKLDSEFISKLKEEKYDLFIVASYGKIIPKEIIDMPKYGTLNVHPSLLPKLRGASPIEGAILSGEKTGVTIMLIDEEMDHGPIIAQKELDISNSEILSRNELEEKLAKMGGEILADTIPKWIAKELNAKEQEHKKATYTKKIKKEDGLIDLNESAEKNLRKIRAYDGWPGAYFFINHNTRSVRVLIKNAEIKEGKLDILRVVPEGKKEMSWDDFARGYQYYLGNSIKSSG